MKRFALVLPLALAAAVPLFLILGAAPATAAGASGTPAAPADCRAGLTALLARFDRAVVARDSAAAASLCRPADPKAAAHLADLLASWRALDTLACESRLGSVSCSGSRATAAVFRRLAWREYGRDQCSTQWSTVEFRRDGGAWAIASDADRDNARARDTDLSVRLDPDKGTMRGEATLHVAFEADGEDDLLLGLNRGLDVTALRDARGDSMAYERTADVIVVPLDRVSRAGGPLGRAPRAGDTLTVRVEFAGGLFNESAENHYSQVSIAPSGCFASWVTAWYPHVQGPGSKSRGRIAFDVPAGLTVVASGRPAERSTTGDRERQTFEVDRPLDFSFAAAKYLHRERAVDGIAVGAYLLSGDERKAERYLDASAAAIRASRDRYGMYPYDAYDLVEIPNEATGSLGGSSEQGMNLFPVGVLPDSVAPLALLAHEIGHSWWGNLVELSGSLSEAMAQYSAALCLRDLEGEDSMRRFLVYGRPELPSQSQAGYFNGFAGDPERDRPIGAGLLGGADSGLLHDLADTKGFVVLDMLRQRIGDRAFVEGMRSLIRDFAGRKAQLADLEAAWEKASGQRLDGFVRQWFTRTGAPELALEDTVIAAGKGFRVRGRIVQRREPYDLDVEVVAVVPGDPVVRRVHVTGRETAFEFAVAARPRSVLLDPDHKVLRWCDEFNHDGLVAHAMRLRADGKDAEAADTLEAAWLANPTEYFARYQLGILHQDAGRFADAASAFGDVARAFESYPAYAPTVAMSYLRLGETCDVLGRRDSALAAYRRVMRLPDEAGTRDDASRYLLAPYARPTGAPGPDSLRTFAGTYSSGPLGSLTVSVNEAGGLKIQQEGQPASLLEWSGGTRFGLLSRPGASVEFVDSSGGHAGAMVVSLGNYRIRLARAK